MTITSHAICSLKQRSVVPTRSTISRLFPSSGALLLKRLLLLLPQLLLSESLHPREPAARPSGSAAPRLGAGLLLPSPGAFRSEFAIGFVPRRRSG